MQFVLDDVTARFKKRIDIIIVLTFAILIGIIRLPFLGHLSFWWDEAAQVIVAEAIFQHGYPVLPTGVFYWHGFLTSYSIAFSFLILGINEFSARIVSLIFSVLTLLVTYLLGKDLHNIRLGALATFIVAFSSWAVAWSRQARMYSQFQFFSLLTIYLFYKIYFAKQYLRTSIKYNILLTGSFLCALLSHELAITLIPGLLLYPIIAEGFTWIKRHKSIVGLFILGSLFLAIIFFVVGSVLTRFKLSWLIFNIQQSYMPFLTRYPILSVFVIMGASILLMNRDKKSLYLYTNLLIPLILVPIMVAGLGVEVFERHIFFLLPIFILTATFSLLRHLSSFSIILVKKLAGIASLFSYKRSKNVVTWAILILIIFPVISNLYVAAFVSNSPLSPTDAFSYYKVDHPSPWIDIEYGGFRVACEFVSHNYQDEDAIISTQHLPTYYYLKKIMPEKKFDLFFLRQQRGGTSKIDHYLNSTIIDTYMELENVLYQYERVWIIVDERFVRLYAHPIEVINFVFNSTTLVYENNPECIQVFLWS